MDYRLFTKEEEPFLRVPVQANIGDKIEVEDPERSYLVESHLYPKLFLPFDATYVKRNKYVDNHSDVHALKHVLLATEDAIENLGGTLLYREMGGPFFYKQFFGALDKRVPYPVYIYNIVEFETESSNQKNPYAVFKESFKLHNIGKRNDLVYVEGHEPSFAHAFGISRKANSDDFAADIFFFDELSFERYKQRTANDKLPAYKQK